MGYYCKNKKRSNMLAVIVCLLAVLLLAMESKADMEPGYNITVKIEPANTVYLNEKIEVHCEKNGQYYMTIDLNKTNRYEYKKVLESGIYTFQARVRYDMGGEYTILPDSQSIEITYNNSNILNEVTFTIDGVRGEPELHSHLATKSELQEQERLSPNEKIYTIEDIDELYAVQESMISEGEAAFDKQETWEQNNNFAAIHGINPVPAMENAALPMHDYPDTEDESNENNENPMESEEITIAAEDDSESERTDISEIKGPIFIVMTILAVLAAAITTYWWRNRNE